jgi:esterase/lipase
LVDKEVAILKQKLVRVIYVKMESSGGTNVVKAANKRPTKELVTLLKALGEEKRFIDERLLLSRAKFMKDSVQTAMVRSGAKAQTFSIQTSILKQFLDLLVTNLE